MTAAAGRADALRIAADRLERGPEYPPDWPPPETEAAMLLIDAEAEHARDCAVCGAVRGPALAAYAAVRCAEPTVADDEFERMTGPERVDAVVADVLRVMDAAEALGEQLRTTERPCAVPGSR